MGTTVGGHRRHYLIARLTRRCGAMPKRSLPGFAAGPFGIGFAPSFGKRSSLPRLGAQLVLEPFDLLLEPFALLLEPFALSFFFGYLFSQPFVLGSQLRILTLQLVLSL